MQESLFFPAAPDPTKNLRKILRDSTILAVISEEAERKNSALFFSRCPTKNMKEDSPRFYESAVARFRDSE